MDFIIVAAFLPSLYLSLLSLLEAELFIIVVP